MNPLFLWATTGLWAVAVFAWLAVGMKRFWSPWALYLIFHLFSFVIRPWLVFVRKDQDYLHNYVGIPTTWADHEWALIHAGLALIALSVGCFFGENRARGRPAPRTARMLEPKTALLVGLPLIVVGFVSLAVYGQTPWSSTGNTAQLVSAGSIYTSVSTTPSYITHSYLLMSGVFIVWILTFGFRWIYLPVLVVFFVLVAYQEAARTTYVIGVTALVAAHLIKKGRSLPSLGTMVPVALAVVSFVSGKAWMYDLINSGRAAAAGSASSGQENLLAGEGELFLNYEMLVMTTYVVPEHADYSYLSFYGRMIYQFIPRAIWPQKPAFDYIVAYFSFEVPEINTQGLIPTLPGESYVAFGTPGVVVILFAFGFAASYLFSRSLRYPAASVETVMGIALSMACFQIYRDGVTSLTTYGMFYAGPALIVWGVSLILGVGRREVLDSMVPPENEGGFSSVPRLGGMSSPEIVRTRPLHGIHARRSVLAPGDQPQTLG